jgi:transposase
MDDTELYANLLEITTLWRLTRVTVNVPAERIDVRVEESPGTQFLCPTCREPAAVYDHTPEQVWRHLDTCQCRTYVHARLPDGLSGGRGRAGAGPMVGGALPVHPSLRDPGTRHLQFTREELATVEAIAMDMWEPYILATHACVPDAARKIVFDRYHATTQVTKAVDDVRRQEHKTLTPHNDLRLKGTRYLWWLWNAENVPEWRRAEFDTLKQANLKTSRAWAIKESLRGFWTYGYPRSAPRSTSRPGTGGPPTRAWLRSLPPPRPSSGICRTS